METAVSATVNGLVAGAEPVEQPRRGARAVPSARLIAIIFGTCSPTVMWSEVASVKAIAKASAVATPCERPPKAGSIRSASAGSPRKPIPIEAIVIPSWQAERYSSIWSSWRRTRLAAPLALVGELLDLAAAGADERELGGDEEAVERDQDEQRDERDGGHRQRPRSAGRLLRGRARWGPVLEGSSSIIGDGARLATRYAPFPAMARTRTLGQRVDLLRQLEVVRGQAALGVGAEA